MVRWSIVVVFLYALALLVLTLPTCLVAFMPQLGIRQAAEVFFTWQYWLLLAVLMLCQFALLIVKVKVVNRRPIHRSPILFSLLATGFMSSLLMLCGLGALAEGALGLNSVDQFGFWSAITIAILTWILWAFVFYRISKVKTVDDWLSLQCKKLIQGSILELLVAVPSHIIARHRTECCAGLFTFAGLAAGIAVMLFAFGPAVFLLFADRLRRLQRRGSDA